MRAPLRRSPGKAPYAEDYSAMPDILLRILAINELSRVREVDVSESGTVVYIQKGSEIEPTHEEWRRPPRDDAGWAGHVELWESMLAHGATAIGAFDGDTLVGIAVHRPRLSEGTSQLAGLFVSDHYRRRGIAKRLTDEVVRLARASGASRLYVSATPSESAVGFYTSQGFRPTEEVNPELYAIEPEDIHMIKPL